nr:hypothetical protein [uncultured Undibacterium sp.]
MRSDLKPRAFFAELLTRKKIPLPEVLTFFINKNGKHDSKWASQFILEIHGGDALCLIDQNGNELSFSESCFQNAEQYTLAIKDMAALDSHVQSGYLIFADLGLSVEEIPPESYCALQFSPMLRIVGDKVGAESLVERIRAFTHFFAHQLSIKRIAVAANFLSSAIVEINNEAQLSEKIGKLEAIYGELSFFDRVTVNTVYHGKGRDKKLFREMDLPKGMRRDLRRGESEFHLVGMHTPSGSMIHAVRISLGIIEENGLLKIASIAWHKE